VRYLSVAVHPDDETLGCGGTLLRQRAEGDEIDWLLVTRAGDSDYASAVVARQQAVVESVRRAYGFREVEWLAIPTTRLGELPRRDIVGALAGAIRRLRPDVVLGPFRHDVHSDHRVVAEALGSALKAFCLAELGVRKVLECETLSETDSNGYGPVGFRPSLFWDVSPFLERKLEILSLYEAELQQGLRPRTLEAVRAQARLRGATVAVKYAEAFAPVWEVVPVASETTPSSTSDR